MTFMDHITASKGKRLLIGGHRGHQSEHGENTTKNFSRLLGKGIPYVEIDVQLTRDNQVVAFHDMNVEVRPGQRGDIRDFTLETLRKNIEIETAAEIIRWGKEHHMGIAFDLKTQQLRSRQDRGLLAEKLAGLIAQYGFQQECFVFGKGYEALSIMKTIDPSIKLGVIAPPNPEEALPLMRRLEAFLYLDYLSGLSETLVGALHEEGYLVDGSVVNTEEALREAIRLGVDMIESDVPEKMLRILEKIPESETHFPSRVR